MKEENSKNYITVRENGLFFNAFDDDAKIISYFFNYKVKKNIVGFPKNSLGKVTNMLEEKKIDYEVIKGEEKEFKTFKNLNNYHKYLAKASKKYDVNKIVQDIMDRLYKMNEEELYDLLNKINEVSDGKR